MRPDRDTDTETRHPQTTTGDQTQRRTTADRRKQHNTQQKSRGQWGRTEEEEEKKKEKRKKNTKSPSRSDENRETQRGRGGGGRNQRRAANGQAGDTKEARAHGEPGSKRPGKTTKTQRQGPGHPGPETGESRRQLGRAKGEEKKKTKERKATGNGNSSEEEGGQSRKTKRPKEKGEAHHNAPGRPARPTRPQRASTRTPAAVQMDECAPGGYPAPAGYEQPPSGWTSARPEGTLPLPATNSRRPDGRVCAQRVPSSCRLRTAAVRMDE